MPERGQCEVHQAVSEGRGPGALEGQDPEGHEAAGAGRPLEPGKKIMTRLDPKYVKLDPKTRLHGLQVPVIGLTGGIATGKSTFSKMLEQKGAPVIDADRLVKDIYKLDETKTFIAGRCPDGLRHGEVHFPTLRERFFG